MRTFYFAGKLLFTALLMTAFTAASLAGNGNGKGKPGGGEVDGGGSTEPTYSAVFFNPLLPDGFNESYAYGMNEDGDVVGMMRDQETNNQTAFFYHCATDTLVDLNELIDDPSDRDDWLLGEATGINDDGRICGTGFYLDTIRAYRFQPGYVDADGEYVASAVENLGTLDADSFASDINAAGDVTGYYRSGSRIAYLFTDADLDGDGVSEGMISLGTLDGGYSDGLAINKFFEIAGYAGVITENGAQNHAALFTPSAGWTDLGSIPPADADRSSAARDINDLGQVTGGKLIEVPLKGNRTSFEQHVFRYSDGTMEDLGTPVAGSNADGLGINGSGDVVASSGGDGHLYRSETQSWESFTLLTGLDLGVYSGTDIRINDAGWICGTGIAPDGFQEAFLLVPTP